jgi:hypothetical protein
MAMAMASGRAMAVNALMLLALLVLRPGAAIAASDQGEDPMHRALFDHIQEIRALSESAAAAAAARGEVEDAGGDWIGSLGMVEEPAGEAEPVVEEGGGATSDLFAHIDAVQRQVQEAEAEFGKVSGEGSEGAVVVDGEEEKEREREVEVVVDPLVQEKFKLLEAALKSLKDEADDGPKELRVQGAEDGEVVSLLENFARETHRKLHPDGASRESQLESDRSPGHERLHRHDHGHGRQHHHDHDRGDAHANAGFSRASDAHYHKHDHNGHSHGHQHGESIKNKRFMLPEEITEEEDLLDYGFEEPVHSNPEQPNRLRGQELGSSFSQRSSL